MVKEKQKIEKVTQMIAQECTSVRLRKINRVISSIYDEALRPHGLKISQMNILVAISILGPAKPGDICKALQLEKSTLSRNLERMEKKGWIRLVSGDDGRSHEMRITAKGRNLILELEGPWLEAQKKTRELIGGDGVRALRNISSKIGHQAT